MSLMGEYETEKRAREVLQEIAKLFSIREIKGKDYEEIDLILKIKKLAIYEMPKE